MDSLTKNRQSPEVLKAMIAKAYGEDAVPDSEDFFKEMGHGWFNVAYAITLRDGRKVVLKIAPPAGVTVMSYEHDMMRNELDSLAMIDEHTSVPVARVEYSDTSGEIIEAFWFFMPFIEGENLGIMREEGRISDEDLAVYDEEVGRLNKELNSMVGGHYGRFQGPFYSTWREAFTDMIEEVLVDGERVELDLGWDYGLIRQIIAQELPHLDAVTEPRFVEWDLWNSNVMVRDGKIAAIIDHERALYGDPLFEAGFTSIDLADFGNPEAFMRGYGMGTLDENAVRRRLLYSLYLILIMIIETNYRAHEDSRQYEWAKVQLTTLMGRYGFSPDPE